jgi:hypothetical protein
METNVVTVALAPSAADMPEGMSLRFLFNKGRPKAGGT